MGGFGPFFLGLFSFIEAIKVKVCSRNQQNQSLFTNSANLGCSLLPDETFAPWQPAFKFFSSKTTVPGIICWYAIIMMPDRILGPRLK